MSGRRSLNRSSRASSCSPVGASYLSIASLHKIPWHGGVGFGDEQLPPGALQLGTVRGDVVAVERLALHDALEGGHEGGRAAVGEVIAGAESAIDAPLPSLWVLGRLLVAKPSQQVAEFAAFRCRDIRDHAAA